MIRLATAALVAAVLVLAGPALAHAAGVKIGDEAPSYSGLEGVDGKKHSLDELKDKEVVVLCITCNHCPWAVKYEDRMIDFTKKNAGKDSKVAFVAINVNNLPADKLDKMKERAEEKGFNFQYLYDPSQKTARGLGATVTPHFFVLDKSRKVVYMGAMDDNPANPDKVKVNYVEAAVQAVLKGEKPDKTVTKPTGCGVKYESE